MKVFITTICLGLMSLTANALQRADPSPVRLYSVLDHRPSVGITQSLFRARQAPAQTAAFHYPGGRDDAQKKFIAYGLLGLSALFFIGGFLLMVHASDVATQAGHPGERDQGYQLLSYISFGIGIGLGATGSFMIHNPWENDRQGWW